MTDARVGDGTVAGEIAKGLTAKRLDEQSCRRLLAGIVRPVLTCTGCGDELQIETFERLVDGRRAFCKCGREATLFSGTVLSGLSIRASSIVMACALRHFGSSLAEIAAACSVDQSTVSRLLDRLSIPVTR